MKRGWELSAEASTEEDWQAVEAVAWEAALAPAVTPVGEAGRGEKREQSSPS